MTQRTLFRTKSMPQLGKWRNVPKRVEDLDKDLSCDPISGEFIRHPVFASDGRVYEATSLLEIFRTSGRSPFKMDNPIVAAFYSPVLKALLDIVCNDDENRCEDYNITPVLKEINNWVKTFNDEPINLTMQQRLLPDTRREVRQEDPDAPYANTFLHALLTWQRGESICCLPPVSFWSRRLNKPAINAAANTYMILEICLFLFAFSLLLNDKSFSKIGLFDLATAFFNSSVVSLTVAFSVSLATVVGNRTDVLDFSSFR